MTDTAYLVDGSGYIFRAFYAVAPLSTSSGFPTNALFGFSRMLLKLLSSSDARWIGVVFDAGRETFRNELYAEYKANRTECPPDLLEQMPYFRTISEALGLRVLELKGYEADDLIGTIASRLVKTGMHTVIVTADKDLMQLVNDDISLWDTMRDKRVGRAEVIEKFGVGPESVIDILGLMGDSSDNIPGLKGVGPKTATQLVQRYGNIETIISKVAEIRADSAIKGRAKIADQIENDVATLRLSRDLATIRTDVPLLLPKNGANVDVLTAAPQDLLSLLEREDPNAAQIQALSERFEFSSLFANVSGPSNLKSSLDDTRDYRTVWKKDFDTWLLELKEIKEFSLDLETTSLDPLVAKIVGIAICWSSEYSFYIPVGHREKEEEEQLSPTEAIEALRSIFEDLSIKKCGHNLKYDMSVLSQNGIDLKGVDFDSMIATYLLNPDRGSFKLGNVSEEYLGMSSVEYSEVTDGKENFAEVSVKDATRYAAEDAHYAWMLKEKLFPLLVKEGLQNVFETIEIPLIPILSHLELFGVRLDEPFFAKLSDDFAGELKQLEDKIYELAGSSFNINSPKQLSEILFDKLGIPTKGLKKTKTGISTDSSVLEKLKSQHPLPEVLLRYRLIHKLKSTYVDALPAQISPISGRLHTKLNQTGTGTGRLSSSEPNLQNIPISTEEGRRIRRGFIATDGSVLISADYSQIELRILACMSEDEGLISAFEQNIDIHEKTAREVFSIGPIVPVPPELRRIGKTLNFGIVYGMSGFRLSNELGITVKEGQQYIDQYFARYPKVKELFSRLEADAANNGEVHTLFGRKRVLMNLDTTGRDAGFVARVATNAPLQGTAADLIKLAMIKTDAMIKNSGIPCRMLLQIHDELLFECKKSKVDETMALIRDTMEHVVDWRVPLKVDVSAGDNWDEAH